MSRVPGATIFIGNIPYDISESKLSDLFSEAGPIKSLRLVTDRDSGKPKGYGFCEYFDAATAEIAMRNLNGHEVGGRSLRVDFADDASRSRDWEKRQGQSSGRSEAKPGIKTVGMATAASAAGSLAAALGDFGSTAADGSDALTKTLAGMTKPQMYEVMSQMKALVAQNRVQARQILLANPQLTKALFQTQIILGMVKNPMAAVQPQQQPLQMPAAGGGMPPQMPQHQPQGNGMAAGPHPAGAAAPAMPMGLPSSHGPPQGMMGAPAGHGYVGPPGGAGPPFPGVPSSGGPPPGMLQMPPFSGAGPMGGSMPGPMGQGPGPGPQGMGQYHGGGGGLPGLGQPGGPSQFHGDPPPPLGGSMGFGGPLRDSMQMQMPHGMSQPMQQQQQQQQDMGPGRGQGPYGHAPGSPPSQQQPPQQGMQLAPEAQQALMDQVMNLTPQQIERLPEEHRRQVLQLQQQIRQQQQQQHH
uniref:Cleavage stimulation factor subunit 2 n=1 Tax=Tetraselmis sp. GSL018 TaxID=582737 RepID=A0A061RP61_9CHLO|eukprot:CAMPEP_0177622016 /NCGR_PEP_ID=MMETSP0419_2-20121207/27979_1 /TAXON_ID=582737 /ORGANISM="Tetraselmis sp., Strain GSL018" /LENGTH=467 /DNA_ID=CAMNT_0019122143 /DNA_START=83 /DNA_END=1486 /DNA_ORIENTATION=-